jgi:hypothetical protein
VPLGKVGRVQPVVRRNNADAKTQPLTQLHYGEAHDEEIKGRPGNILGSPSDPQDLAEGATGDSEQSTANPIEVRSLLPTPAEEDLIDGGTRTWSSSPLSSRSDFGQVI